MKFKEIRRRVVNADEKSFYDKRFAIFNEYGAIAFVYADSDQDALDAAMDSGHLESELMDMVDYREYEEKGWDDSYILLGNASEPVWAEHLRVINITRGEFSK